MKYSKSPANSFLRLIKEFPEKGECADMLPIGLRCFSSSFLGWGKEGRGEFFVEGKEVFDALAVGIEWLRAVAKVNGAVEVGVGFHERGRHFAVSL